MLAYADPQMRLFNLDKMLARRHVDAFFLVFISRPLSICFCVIAFDCFSSFGTIINRSNLSIAVIKLFLLGLFIVF
jgi:hypothetical protein